MLLRAYALLLAGAMTAGCGLDVVEISVIEQGQAGLAGVSLPGMDSFGSSLTGLLYDKGVDPDDVDSMRVLSCTFEMLSQSGLTQDLSFLQKLEFWVEADGMERRLLARQSSFPEGTRKADLGVTQGLDLQPYLKAGRMRVTSDAPLNTPPPDRVDLQVTFRIRVDVDVV